MVSKGIGMALGSLKTKNSQKAHNKKNRQGTPFGQGPFAFEPRCPTVRYDAVVGIHLHTMLKNKLLRDILHIM